MKHIAEIELSYRNNLNGTIQPKITSSEEAYAALIESWDFSKIQLLEEFKILLLNRANLVLGISTISSGGTSGTVVDSKLIFVSAIKSNTSAIILAHNHPSGNLKPSQNDIELTNRIKQAGELLEINVVDHLILSKDGYFSFADESLL